MATTWGGTLQTNEVFTSIYNMIISQHVFADNIESKAYRTLVSRFRTEGSMYGDTKLFYSTDVLRTKAFALDSVSQLNLLAIDRPKDPFCQAITLDQFRFIEITLDEYFSKRAWSTPNSFSAYNGSMLTWMRDTKDIYDQTIFNTYVGTTETSVGKQQQEVDISSAVITTPTTTMDDEAKRRLITELIAEKLENIFVDMRDVNDDWNDLQYTRTYDPSNFEIVWNADWVNYMKSTGLPSLFHKDGLISIKDENILPAHYFGTPEANAGTSDGTKLAITESYIVNNAIATGEATHAAGGVDVWAGKPLPNGTAYGAGEAYTQTPAVLQNGSIICKFIHKDAIPYMSGYQTEKEFINPKNLSNNHYLHFAHNKLQYLFNYPLITVKAKA